MLVVLSAKSDVLSFGLSRQLEQTQLELTKANEKAAQLEKNVEQTAQKAEQSQQETLKIHQAEVKTLQDQLSDMVRTTIKALKLCRNMIPLLLIFYCLTFHQKNLIETTQHQVKDIQAKHEKATSELMAKHDAEIQEFKQNLLDAEEALKSAQSKNSKLEAQAEELQKQAEQARVSGFCHSASDLKFKFSVSFSLCFSLS